MKCNDISLDVVFASKEHSAKYADTVEHLSVCEVCQRKLESMYTQDATLCELSAVLRDSGEHELADYTQEHSDTVRPASKDVFEVPITHHLNFLEPASHPELLGRLGRYDVERVVGAGGTGVVLKAYDTELHRVVALKVLAAHLAHHASSRLRFAREARAAAAILHPNVLPIYNVEANSESPFLVMHYVPGESLQARVERSGPLPVEEALRIAKQTAAAIAAAHQQGLIHRDVKPANILLEDKTDRVVLSDFGLARSADDAAVTSTGFVAGTPQYMSPEQACGDSFDHRTDLFSLGSVLYFMLTGRPPFRGNSAVAVLHRICRYRHQPVTQLNNQVPREVSQLVDALLQKKPHNRCSSATEVADRLELLLAKHQSGSLSLLANDRKSQIASLVCAVVVLSIALLWSVWPPDSGMQASDDNTESNATTNEIVDNLDVPDSIDFAQPPSELSAFEGQYAPLQQLHKEMLELDRELHRTESHSILDPNTSEMIESLFPQNPHFHSLPQPSKLE